MRKYGLRSYVVFSLFSSLFLLLQTNGQVWPQTETDISVTSDKVDGRTDGDVDASKQPERYILVPCRQRQRILP